MRNEYEHKNPDPFWAKQIASAPAMDAKAICFLTRINSAVQRRRLVVIGSFGTTRIFRYSSWANPL